MPPARDHASPLQPQSIESSSVRYGFLGHILRGRTFRAGAVATAALLLAACSAQHTNVIHQERSLYRNIYVTQEGNERCMVFRVRIKAGPQGCIDLRDPSGHALEYSKLEMAGLYVVPEPRSVLVVGLGVGAIPRTIQEMFPNAKMDVVEIDPSVVKIAAQYFGYHPGPNVRMVVDDGRHFVRSQLRQGRKYDLVFLDAFNGEYIPEHLVTAEFLTEVKNILAPGGAVAANTWSHSKLFDSESATYQSVFGGFLSIKRANRIILTTDKGAPPATELKKNATALDSALNRYGISKSFLVPLIDQAPKWDTAAPLLTDQYSPANLLNQ